MTITCSNLIKLLDSELKPHLFKDYCPNGLQVMGKNDINCIVTGVTASQELINQAILLNADAILVHHGYFWKNESPVITGMKQKRIKTLLEHNINLIAYHLPLDAHPVLGNNVNLAKIMDWNIKGGIDNSNFPIGNWGTLTEKISAQQLAQSLNDRLHHNPVVVEVGNKLISKIAWCTGGAQNLINVAIELGVDAYISGEISESTVHYARENNIHYFAAGHHATERYGIKELGKWLESKINIKHHFIDIYSPA